MRLASKKSRKFAKDQRLLEMCNWSEKNYLFMAEGTGEKSWDFVCVLSRSNSLGMVKVIPFVY